jgi:Zn-dependent protease
VPSIGQTNCSRAVLPRTDTSISIEDLGPTKDNSEIHLVRVNHRHFRVQRALLSAIQRGATADFNPSVLREFHRFEQELMSPSNAADGADHLKFRTDFSVDSMLGSFEWITKLLASRTMFKVASVATVAVLILAACATLDRHVRLTGSVLFGSVLLLLLTSFMHEIGHLSVARHLGAPASRMGIGLFWGLFPAFYADVTSAWLLEKKHRIAVTLAGPFYTLLSIILLGIGSIAIPGPVGDAFRVALSISMVSFVFNLLPFGRLDGYWVLVDLTGERSLSKRSNEFLRNVWSGAPLVPTSTFLRLYSVFRTAMMIGILFLLFRAAYRLTSQVPTLFSTGTEIPKGLLALSAIYGAVLLIWLSSRMRKSLSRHMP